MITHASHSGHMYLHAYMHTDTRGRCEGGRGAAAAVGTLVTRAPAGARAPWGRTGRRMCEHLSRQDCVHHAYFRARAGACAAKLVTPCYRWAAVCDRQPGDRPARGGRPAERACAPSAIYHRVRQLCGATGGYTAGARMLACLCLGSSTGTCGRKGSPGRARRVNAALAPRAACTPSGGSVSPTSPGAGLRAPARASLRTALWNS